MTSIRHVVAGFLLGLGAGGIAWAASLLEGGFAALPSHWWSSLAVLPVAAGLALLAAPLTARGGSSR